MSESRVSAELRRATISGARWTLGSRLAAESAAFVSSIILARLITPAEFGQAAVALIVVALSAILGTSGIAAPLVQRHELSARTLDAVTVVCLLSALGLTAITLVVSDVLIDPLFGQETARLVALASPAWLLVAIGSPSQALLQRRLRFRLLAAIEVASVVAGAALAVSLAVAGLNGEALVAGALCVVGVAGVLSLAASPTWSLSGERAVIREVLGFAGPVALSSLVYLGFRNVDYVILGARSSVTQLGYYWRAFQLGVDYQSKLSRVMLRVSFPVYSRASGMDELRSIRTRIVRGHASMLVPLLAFFIAVAPVVVPWLYGPAWEPSVRPAQILAVAGMADAIVTGVGPLLVAIGKPGQLLRWNLIVLTAYAAMVFVLAPLGVNAVAIGVAVFGVGTVLGSQAVLLRPHAGLSFRQLWHDIRAGLVVGFGVFLATTATREGLDALAIPVIPTLAVLGGCGAIVYGVLLRTLFHPEWADLRAVAGRIRVRPRESESATPTV